jgi:peptide-methionine (R)-S-oxide reductase
MHRSRATQATAPPEIQKPDEQWRQELTRQQYDVLRRGHTEVAFTGRYLYGKDNGSYCCAGCGNELFRSDAKFASGTGWPSFFQPASEEAVELRTDQGWLLRRTEVVCRRCGGHLGHVFRDGPRPTRRRYCINSCALSFEPTPPDHDLSDRQPGS